MLASGTRARGASVKVIAMMLALLLAACSTALPAGPVPLQTGGHHPVCEAARVGGTLVAAPYWGLAFERHGDPSGLSYTGVRWPFGYTARRGDDGVVVLIDPEGRVIAREGDRIVAAGANGGGEDFVECDIQVIPREP
jgi:hypothetical protein